jgi:predicted enzyme related to lactoylglutathione lyase
MKRVTGIGGIFFKCNDVDASRAWYHKHLGIETDQYGGCFEWQKSDGTKGHTVWSTFKNESSYMEPSTKGFMVNYRVEDLEALLPILKSEGVTQIGEIDIQEYGKFAWIMDLDGNKIELWEPPQNFEDLASIRQVME